MPGPFRLQRGEDLYMELEAARLDGNILTLRTGPLIYGLDWAVRFFILFSQEITSNNA